MLFQFGAFDFTVLDVPYLCPRIPSAVCRLGLFPQSFVAISNAHRYLRVIFEAVRGRRPGFSLNDQFNRLQPGLAQFVVPIANSEERVAVFGDKIFGPFLSRQQF